MFLYFFISLSFFYGVSLKQTLSIASNSQPHLRVTHATLFHWQLIYQSLETGDGQNSSQLRCASPKICRAFFHLLSCLDVLFNFFNAFLFLLLFSFIILPSFISSSRLSSSLSFSLFFFLPYITKFGFHLPSISLLLSFSSLAFSTTFSFFPLKLFIPSLFSFVFFFLVFINLCFSFSPFFLCHLFFSFYSFSFLFFTFFLRFSFIFYSFFSFFLLLFISFLFLPLVILLISSISLDFPAFFFLFSLFYFVLFIHLFLFIQFLSVSFQLHTSPLRCFLFCFVFILLFNSCYFTFFFFSSLYPCYVSRFFPFLFILAPFQSTRLSFVLIFLFIQTLTLHNNLCSGFNLPKITKRRKNVRHQGFNHQYGLRWSI